MGATQTDDHDDSTVDDDAEQEEEHQVEAGADGDDEGSDDKAGDDDKSEAGDDDKTEDEEGDDEGDKSKDGADDEDGDGKDKSKEKKQDDDDGEPPVRKTKKDFIIERLQRKRDNKSEKPQAKEKPAADDGDTDDEEGDDEPETKGKESLDEKISKAVTEALNPILDEQEESEINRDVDNFLNDTANADVVEAIGNPEKLRRWAKHPSRRQIPVNEIAYALAGRKLMKIGAKKERVAGKEAAATRGAGHSKGGSPDGKEPSKLPTQEFRQFKDKVLRQQKD